ncbi:immunity 52 family protein [Photorhabdus tasmaniensis]|uniref:immunity 52 family protein n=1 Tax=Photorhabdus tasmaniensis TaxID=1004159 RepID=UPI0040426743
MFIIHPRIKLFYDLREAITPELALADTYQLMNNINDLSNNSSGWHLPGYSEEEIRKNHVFNENGITEYALKEFREIYEDDGRSIIVSLFDNPIIDNPESEKLENNITYIGQDDIYSNPKRLVKTNTSINLALEKENFNLKNFIDFIKHLVSHRYSPFITTETRGYRLNQKQVFPDRLSAGWMLYLPIEIDPTLVPMAEEIISISDKNDKKGSLIITTKDIFNIENQEHINKANDIEICLRDLQILPLMTEL